MYTPKNYETLIGTPGFSDEMLKNHFTLYEGYVKNVNLLDTKLGELTVLPGLNGPEFNELKRRYGWEYNGMYLHELYFENMKKGGSKIEDAKNISLGIEKQFGSFDAWKTDFIATGAMRGIGWAILVKTNEGLLKNIWINEHDVGYLAGATPLIVMDVFEHSFMFDYGLKRVDYINAFFAALDWDIVDSRI